MRRCQDLLSHMSRLADLGLLVLVLSGACLLSAYQVSPDPYQAVAALDRTLLGRTLRSLHRYAADALLLFTLGHGLREAVAGRYRAGAGGGWITGGIAAVLLLVIGATGYIMPWDRLALLVLSSATRALDPLPLFAEPPSRVLVPGHLTPWLFFFALLGHVVLSFWLVMVLGAHIIRVVRPRLWPGRALGTALLAGLLFLATGFPVTSQGPADPGTLPDTLLIDRFYLFWLPWAERLGPGRAAAAFVGLATAATLLPALAGRRRRAAPDGTPAHGNKAGGP